jgi:PrtD family type I secretion system ABC transporter
VLDGKASAGIMFASSILTSRALAPVESAIANWKGLAAARLSFARLNDQLKAMPARPPRLPLPAPERHFVVEDLSVKAPLGELPIVTRVSFRLEAGDGLALIGPSGGGKSTLLHGLIGIWPIEAGEVRFDGAAISQWEPDAIGRHIGYLPQSVELMSGTIAENISRFDPAATMDDIIAAARQAAVHDLVLRMPKGYETPIGSDGQSLSAGQRQRIGLARALYRNPFLVVLDEPNSNLDVEGEAALAAAVIAVRQRKGIVIIAAHRIEILKVLNKIGEMRQGQLAQFGPRDAIWKGILDRAKSLRPVKTEITAVRDA